MSNYPTLNRLVLAKIESTPGTDASPTAGANAILVASPNPVRNLNTFETDEVTGSLDDRGPIPSSANQTYSARVYLHGSGTSGTVEPEVAPFLKASGRSVSALAADVTATAQAGATSTITLAAGDSGTTDQYRGMVIEITSGTGSGQRRIITRNNSTTKVATVTPAWTVTPTASSVYAIRKCHVYRPTSAALPCITIYDYGNRNDGGNSKLYKILGAQGNMTFNMEVNQACYFSFDFTGTFVAPSDVAAPAAGTFQPTRPIAFNNAQVYFGDSKIKSRQFSYECGNRIQQTEDPNATYGLDIANIARRQSSGTFQAPKELEAVRNVVNSWAAGTESLMSFVWGSTSGNRFAVLCDRMIHTGSSDQDVNGLNYEQLPFRTAGADDGLHICFW
jgi:hypothetical protein